MVIMTWYDYFHLVFVFPKKFLSDTQVHFLTCIPMYYAPHKKMATSFLGTNADCLS